MNSYGLLRETQEGCGGLRGESAEAFPKAGPIFQQPFSLLENAQTLAGIAFRAAGKSVKNFPAASNLPENFSSKDPEPLKYKKTCLATNFLSDSAVFPTPN